MEKCRYKSLEELPAIMCADDVKDVRLGKSRVQDLIIDELTAHDLKSGEYKPRSYVPKHEIEAIVRTFYPAVVAFFETEEGNREFEEWKAKKEAEKALKKANEKTA